MPKYKPIVSVTLLSVATDLAIGRSEPHPWPVPWLRCLQAYFHTA